MKKKLSKIFSSLIILMLILPALPVQTAMAVSPDIVISQVYGGGGNSGAQYLNDFVELFNRGTSTVSITGWSVQYASATGSGNFGGNPVTVINGSLAPGQYYLVQMAGGSNGVALPTPDAIGSASMSASSGKVVVVNQSTGLACNGGSTPCSSTDLAAIVDLVGYGSANFYEGSPAPGLSNFTADFRTGDGCTDTDDNSADFTASTPNPRNTASPLNLCGGTTTAEPKINEFSASTTGADVEYVEIYGTPDTDYSAYSVLEIEGDSTGAGVVDEVISLGTTDADGFYLASLPANALENGTISLLLVKNFTGALGDDLDTDNDGNFDSAPWDAIVDAVSVNDGGSGDFTYGVPALGPNYDGVSSFAPGGASRIPDGFDTDAATDWVRNDFDLAGIPGYPGTISLGEAYNTPGAPNEIYVAPPEACGDTYTPIYEVQGNGAASPLVGMDVAIEGVVVGDFQNNGMTDNGELNGFHVQDPVGDGDAATSDGVFVYSPGGMDVAVGDAVRVRGSVSEYFGLTEITASQIWNCGTGSVAPTALSLPVSNVDDFEAYEGMLVTFPQPLVISEYFNFDRFGEIVLTSERHLTPTAEFEPGSPEQQQAVQDYLLDRITLDDGRTNQNPDPAIHPNGGVFDLTNLFRGGDTVANVTGVMDYSFSLYRIQPTQGADYSNENPRPTEPEDVGGNLKVASFNVLNYFTTLDDGVNDICGPAGDQECRGADNMNEFERQRAKIVSAITTINADVVGLLEIENYPGDVPVADLVSGLNDVLGAGTYDYIATGAIGTDAIRVALIYKPATVTPQGAYAILDSTVDPRFLDDYNRPTLTQTFMDNSTGGIFTVAVNHLKSKGSACDAVGDFDLGDGAGNCNLTRKAAAKALVDWLASDPTNSGDADFLIIGDLNSYDKEDPIDAILAGADDILGTDDDYTDMAYSLLGEDAYSYVFDGQIGYLDYALASSNLVAQITGITDWHINADEPDLIDYDTSFKRPNQDAIYAPDAYRSSDHDPVIVGMNLLYYDFSGFFKPVGNLPTVNKDNAGSSIPVKFSLNGDQGLDIFFGGYPKFQQMTCDFTTADGLERADTAGGSTLTYDPLLDQYVYVWKTDKSWSGTCSQLVVILKDGSVHLLNFSFK